MPGAINKEDYALIDITKGIYATNPFQVPEGFTQSLKNFVIRDGIVEQRWAFKTTAANIGAGNWADDIPLLTNPVVLNVDCANTHGKIAAAWFELTPGASRLVGFPTEGFIVSQGPILATQYLGGLVNYNGTIYASGATGIHKLGVANWPTGPVTETLVPGTAGILFTKIITHKSRLFGITQSNNNRLRFTDAPAVGALPENWNIVNNFIDFNGTGVTVIQDVISLNNYLYVFTNAGLFSVYTSGVASNWIVRNINPGVVIRNAWSVVVKNSLIYYLTDEGVFATDGFDFKLISQSLSEFFSGNIQPVIQEALLQPFDNGIVLCVNKRNAAAFGLEQIEKTLFYTKLNQIAWTEWELPATPLTEPNGLNGFWSVDIYFEGSLNYETRAIINYRNAGTGGKTLKTFAFSYRNNVLDGSLNKDQMPNTSVSDIVGRAEYNLNLELITRPQIGSNFMRLKFFRNARIILGSRLPVNMVVQAYFNGKWTPVSFTLPAAETYTVPNVLNDDVAQFIEFGLINQLLLSTQLKFNFEMIWANDALAMVNETGRFAFSIIALGITSTIERTSPKIEQS